MNTAQRSTGGFLDDELSMIIITNSPIPSMTKYIIASPFAAAMLDEQQQVQQNFVSGPSEHIVLS